MYHYSIANHKPELINSIILDDDIDVMCLRDSAI